MKTLSRFSGIYGFDDKDMVMGKEIASHSPYIARPMQIQQSLSWIVAVALPGLGLL